MTDEKYSSADAEKRNLRLCVQTLGTCNRHTNHAHVITSIRYEARIFQILLFFKSDQFPEHSPS